MYKHFWCHLLLNWHLTAINLQYICYSLLFSEGYFVVVTIAYYRAYSAHMFCHPSSTCQCFVDTNPLWVYMLVPRLQEPLTADILSGLIITAKHNRFTQSWYLYSWAMTLFCNFNHHLVQWLHHYE